MDRRNFLASAASLAAAAACAPRAAAPRAAAPMPNTTPGGAPDGAPDGGPLVFVGTYTEGTGSRGVYRFRADPRTGAWRPLGTTDVGPNPSFLAVHPSGRVLYAVNEVERFAGEASGAVRAFAVDRATGDLAPLGDAVATRGGAPCYVAVDASGRALLVANYAGGSVAVLPLAADGRPGAATFVDQHAGRGPRADRQEGPHAHCVFPDPSGRFAVATDLGTDRVHVYALDAAAGRLAPAGPPLAMRPGAGPRHLAFHPSGRTLYVVNELDLTLAALRFDPATGALAVLGAVPLLATPAPAGSTAADVHVHPAGRFAYASVRGDDAVAVFALDPATGAPQFVERVPTGGRSPRNFALDPSGRFLYAANQRSGAIVGFGLDPATGRLAPAGVRVEVPAPVCVRFA